MHKFVRNLITEWRRLNLPFSDENVIVAVSGGADSTALLLALAELRDRKKLTLNFVVAHFNHRLRGKDSDADEKFVRTLAQGLGFSFIKGKGQIKGRSNLEELARNARYSYLAKAATTQRSGFILTAHTINDQAETVLMNIIRGSGPDGFGGMAIVRRISDERSPLLVRPLLRWAKRADTVAYCRDRGVEPRIDAMNLDHRFTRVRIRSEVLPLLAEINPKIVETLAKTAELFRNSEKKTAAKPSDVMKIQALCEMDTSTFRSSIRQWLKEKRGGLKGIHLKHIDSIERLVKSPKSGRIAELPGGSAVVKSGGQLAFREKKLEN